MDQAANHQYDVFLSHNSADKDAVTVLARRLRDEMGMAPFLDKWHLVPGQPWQEALEVALDHSRTCAIFLGPNGLGPWENEEMRAALAMRVNNPEFSVIPVLLPGARLPERGHLPRFLARLTWVDFRTGLDDPQAFHALLCGIKGIAPGAADSTAPTTCPFRGLEVFEEEHAEFFFGREALTQHLVEMLREDRFLAVFGPSGSGKSSLVRAGVIPQIRKGALPESSAWPILLFKPGPHPNESLAARLVPLLGAHADPLQARASVLACLQRDERGLHITIQTALAAAPDHRRVVVVVDQFEEIFTLCRDEREQKDLIANLLYAAGVAGGQTVVIITLRSDFFDKCAAYPDLAARLGRLALVGRMDATDLRRAMLTPAERVGLHYEKGLIDTILDDLGTEPGSLPLLQHTLLELWERRRGQWLTTDAYKEIGGVRGALAQRADAIYQQLTPAQQEVARRTLLRLTQPGEGTEDTRRRAPLSEMLPDVRSAADVQAVVDKLANARLLTMSDDDHGVQMVDVAHEALIRGWPMLRNWIDTNREALRTHRHLTEAVEEWSASGQDASYLFRGARLAQVEEWSEAHHEDLNGPEHEFLRVSVLLRDQEKLAEEARRKQEVEVAQQLAREAEARRAAEAAHAREVEHSMAAQTEANRKLRRGAVLLAVILGVALLLAAAAFILYGVSNQERNTALSRQRGYAAINALDTNQELGLLLAVEAGRTAQTFEADAALRQALVHPGRSTALLAGHTGSVLDAAWSPDGTRIVTAGKDGTARLWDAGSGKLNRVLSGHTASVNVAAWSPDGTRVVTAGDDRTARVWDASTGAQLAVLVGHTQPVVDAGWSLDGTRIVTASKDNTARIWDAGSGAPVATLTGHGDWVVHVAWSPGGDRIVTASYDKTARIWDAKSGQLVRVLADHAARVVDAGWNPAGTHIVTASLDGTARIWDAVTGNSLRTLSGHTAALNSAAWDATGNRIVTTSVDMTARVWNASSGALELILVGHTKQVVQARWNPSGSRIATVGADNTARVWDAQSGRQTALLASHTDLVNDAVWSSDGTRLATASADGSVRVWDPGPGAEQALLTGHSAEVRDVAWNSAGTRVLTTGYDKTARIWDTATGTQTALLTGHSGMVRWGAFDPGGTRVATASYDGTARVWNAATGEPLFVLGGQTTPVAAVWYVAWSRDGTKLVTPSLDHTARVWDAANGKLLATLTGHDSEVVYADWNANGTRIVTAGADKTARIWNASDGTLLQVLKGHADKVLTAEWNDGSTRIVTASADGTARIWEASTGQPVAVLSGHIGGVNAAAWNKAGTRIATAGVDGTARVWDANSGAPLVALTGHHGDVSSVMWDSGGTRLVTAGADHTARIWNAADGTELARLVGHSDAVRVAVWNADGTRVATASADGTARIDYVRVDDLLRAACERTVRNLSLAEWKQYIGDETFRETCAAVSTAPRQ